MNGQNNNPNNNFVNNVNNNQTNKVTPAQSKGESSLNQAQQNSQIDRDANAQKRNVGLQSRSANQKGNNNLPSKSSNNTNNSIHNSNSIQSSNNQSFPQKKNIGDNSFKRYNNKISNTNKKSSKVANKAASTGLTALGVPKPLSDKIVNSKRGQSIMNRIKKRNPMIGLMDKAAKKMEGSDNESQENSPNEPEKENSDENKLEEVSIRIPLKVKIGIIIVSSFLLTVIILLVSILSTDTIQKIIGNKFSVTPLDEGHRADNDEDGNNSGEYMDEDDAYIISKDLNIYATGNVKYIDDKINKNVLFVASKSSKDVDLSGLKDYYELDCNGKDCEKTNIYQFYRKLYDIYYMYKYKYKVNINLALLMTTLNYNSISQDTVFTQNLNDYDKDEVRESDYVNDNVTNLDWEIDYKNLSGYKYLNANDFRYDMQILAKNMVTKKITYKCGDTEKEATDVEKSNYSKGLKCDNGTYDEKSVSESYELDMDKYDEFLLEYIEHKFFLKGSKVEASSQDQTTQSSTLIGNVRYYNQGDYPNNSYGGYGSIQEYGCGPVSLAIVISTLTGKDHDPVEVTNHVCSIGGCTSAGTTLAAITQTAKDYNLKVKSFSSNLTKEIKEAFKQKDTMVIASMGPGTFTPSGHYIVLAGINGDNVVVADPGDRNKNKEWPISTISSESNYGIWVISK